MDFRLSRFSVLSFGIWLLVLASLCVLCGAGGSATVQEVGELEEPRTPQRRLQDVLSTLEDRLRDPFGYTLARLDFNLDQLVRRLDSMEAKLTRLESRMEQADWAKEGQSRQACDHWSSQATYLESKVDVHLGRIATRLDTMERDLHLVRHKPRSLDEDFRTLCRSCPQDGATVREMVTEAVNSGSIRIEGTVRLQSSNVLERVDRSLADLEENLLQQLNESLAVVTASCKHRHGVVDTSAGHEEVELLSLAVQKAISQSESRFRELDSDVELYTRKVLGSIRDLWTSSDQVKLSLDEALRLGNRTRETVRFEFRKLHQQLEPLPRLEPRLADVSSALHRKLGELGTTVDRSFATLLVAQNTFIDNCRRLHDEETQAYDVLQAIVHEMRNRSSTDIGRIAADIRTHGDRLGRSFEAVLGAVFAVGNSTAERIGQLLPPPCARLKATEETEATGEAPTETTVLGSSSKDYEPDYPLPDNDYTEI